MSAVDQSCFQVSQLLRTPYYTKLAYLRLIEKWVHARRCRARACTCCAQSSDVTCLRHVGRGGANATSRWKQSFSRFNVAESFSHKHENIKINHNIWRKRQFCRCLSKMNDRLQTKAPDQSKWHNQIRTCGKLLTRRRGDPDKKARKIVTTEIWIAFRITRMNLRKDPGPAEGELLSES